MILGITGPTGSGKTTLLNLIRDCGGMIFDCDAIYHRLLATDKAMLSAIEARFPGTVEQGILDRKKLGAIVFADENALRELNTITHAAVKKAVLSELSKNPPLAAIDAIGLHDGGLAPLCDVTVAVVAPRENRIARIMARDGISYDYAASRVDAQHDARWFSEKCDHTLENASTPDDFSTQCLAFLHRLGIM